MSTQNVKTRCEGVKPIPEGEQYSRLEDRVKAMYSASVRIIDLFCSVMFFLKFWNTKDPLSWLYVINDYACVLRQIYLRYAF